MLVSEAPQLTRSKKSSLKPRNFQRPPQLVVTEENYNVPYTFKQPNLNKIEKSSRNLAPVVHFGAIFGAKI